MSNIFKRKYTACLRQKILHIHILTLCKFPCKIGDLGNKHAIHLHMLNQCYLLPDTNIHIILTIGRRDMHNSGTIFRCHKISCNHAINIFLCVFKIREKRFVMTSKKFLQINLFFNFIWRFFEYMRQTRFRENIFLILSAHSTSHDNIFDIRIHREKHVARKRPWSGGPSQNFTSFIGSLLDRKRSRHRQISYILVPLRHLKVRQWCLASRTDMHRLIALVDHLPIPDFLEHPPDRLHIGVIQRRIPIFKIHPTTQSYNQLFPLFGISENALSTGIIKLLNTHLNNLLTASKF